MILLTLAVVGLAIAALNAALFLRNLMLYRVPPHPGGRVLPPVSVLIPARNEEACIRASVEAALASRDVDLEVVVLDDHSDDKTRQIVTELSERDCRVRVESAPALPIGWCGKQFACSVLAELASHHVLCFMDSDVRLQPQGLARMVHYLQSSSSGLISGFPHQETETFFERLLLPMMHFLLLGFLPMDLMRRFAAPSLGAGCGQIFVADREAYRKAGGHAAIRLSRHDGISLPRAFRRAGILSDLCDATPVAECRMYHNKSEVFNGLLKNANEGIAAPVRIFVFTALLGLGHLVPFALLFWCLLTRQTGLTLASSGSAAILSLLPRIIAAVRFRQPMLQALLHPIGIIVLLGIQWQARYRDFTGVPAVWKGRSYQTT